MGQYIGDNLWQETIYQFEETDLVLAANDNVPLQNLADRTVWLKNRLGSQFTDEKIITGNVTLSKDDVGCMYRVNATGVITIQLQDASEMPYGAIVPFSSFCAVGAAINIQTKAGQEIFDSEGVRGTIYMHNRETLWLAAFTNHWLVVNSHGNFFCAGEEMKARKVLNNTVAFKGQLLVRAQYPRLWEYASSLQDGIEIVSELTWNFDAFTYRGLFSKGDGVSTFRIPDERAMHERMLDLGRGVDLGRGNYAGSYEADGIKEHRHDVNPNPNSKGPSGQGYIVNGDEGSQEQLDIIKSSGVKDLTTGANIGLPENRVKTIGKLFLVKY